MLTASGMVFVFLGSLRNEKKKKEKDVKKKKENRFG